jgi:D-alanine-D-alanine ligase
MAMDKAVAKRIMESVGVLTPRWRELSYTEADITRLLEELPVPCALKVVNGGSSIGVSLPDTREELEKALHELCAFRTRVIVEEKIRGREITQPILDDHYTPAIEIVPPEGTYFDYVAKYQSGAEGAQEICPARITEAEQKAIGEAALKFHKALGLSVYSRVDFILDGEGRPWCLEVNTLPGMTPNSLIPKAARVEGLGYDELCEKIVLLSLKEHRE